MTEKKKDDKQERSELETDTNAGSDAVMDTISRSEGVGSAPERNTSPSGKDD